MTLFCLLILTFFNKHSIQNKIKTFENLQSRCNLRRESLPYLSEMSCPCDSTPGLFGGSEFFQRVPRPEKGEKCIGWKFTRGKTAQQYPIFKGRSTTARKYSVSKVRSIKLPPAVRRPNRLPISLYFSHGTMTSHCTKASLQKSLDWKSLQQNRRLWSALKIEQLHGLILIAHL